MKDDFVEMGCLVVPKDVNREEFISLCFSKERFWVMTNKHGLLSNVPCIHQVLGDLQFPNDENDFGSQVLIQCMSDYKQYVIIGTVSKINHSTNRYDEENLILDKTYEGKDKSAFGNSIGLSGNTLLSKLTLFCKSVSKKTSELIIHCFGDNKSKLQIKSSGWLFLESESGTKLVKDNKEVSLLDDKIVISLNKDQNLILKDKSFVYTDGNNTFKIDNSGYNLGNINFKDYITEILDFLGNDLVLLTSMGPTSSGCMTSTSAPKLTKLKQKLAQINKK